MSEALMTLTELCERLRCKESWARAQLEGRKWPITWVAKSYRFTEEDFRQILQILAEPPAAERRPARRSAGRPATPPPRAMHRAGSGKRPLRG